MEPIWRWNEFRQIGTDYASVEEVEQYDARMRAMRDVDAENRAILELLKLPEAEAQILEIGVGTGAFIRVAAPHCRRAVGIDISPVMLEYAGRRCAAAGLTNVELRPAGFLSFEAPPESFDGIVTGLAFHHLPDLWKAVALHRLNRLLRPGGRFVLLDVIFDWGREDPEAHFKRLVEAETRSRPNFARHIAQEYSTTAWIIRGLLERAGFIIESEQAGDREYLKIICARRA